MNIFKSTKHNLLAAITVLATSFTTIASATSFPAEVNIGQPFPAILQDGTTYLATIDAGYDFNSIEKVCITGEVNSGTATHATINVVDESNNISSRVDIFLQRKIRSTEGDPVPGFEQLDLNFCITDAIASNLLDGVSEFNLTINGGDLEFNNLKVAIEGSVDGEHADSQIYTTSFGNNLSYPLTLDNGQRLLSETDIGYQFESIESVCIKGEVQDGTAGAFIMNISSEGQDTFNEDFWRIVLVLIDDKSFESFESCGTSELLYNFLDGRSNMAIGPADGYVTLWDLKVEDKGILKNSQIRLSKNDNSTLSVPATGGKLKYDMRIENLDSTQVSKIYRKWSVLKLPNGDIYPHRKAKYIEVNYSEPLVFNNKRIKIPAWFEAGEYEVWWYLADAENNERIVDRLKFVKEEE